ncbi:hypothetical protein EDO6_02866 [Paenibacillus xylanexedens]|nr:hypothetical protein EDO6_02866 [Paenibacillus xylanexedens]
MNLAITKAGCVRFTHRDPDIISNLMGKLGVRIASKYF